MKFFMTLYHMILYRMISYDTISEDNHTCIWYCIIRHNKIKFDMIQYHFNTFYVIKY